MIFFSCLHALSLFSHLSLLLLLRHLYLPLFSSTSLISSFFICSCPAGFANSFFPSPFLLPFFPFIHCFHYSSLLLLRDWLRSAWPLTWTPFGTLPPLHLQHHPHHVMPTPLSSSLSSSVILSHTYLSHHHRHHSLIPLNTVWMSECPTEEPTRRADTFYNDFQEINRSQICTNALLFHLLSILAFHSFLPTSFLILCSSSFSSHSLLVVLCFFYTTDVSGRGWARIQTT